MLFRECIVHNNKRIDNTKQSSNRYIMFQWKSGTALSRAMVVAEKTKDTTLQYIFFIYKVSIISILEPGVFRAGYFQ